MRRVGVQNRGWAAGENDANGRFCANILHRNGAGNNLAKDLGFAHTPCDELGILRAEVKDQHALGLVRHNKFSFRH